MKNSLYIFFLQVCIMALQLPYCELRGKLLYVKQCLNASPIRRCLASWKYIACYNILLLLDERDVLTIMSSSSFYDLKGFYGSFGNENCSICERAHKPSVQVKMRNLAKWKMTIWIFNAWPEPGWRKSMKIKICFSLRHLSRVRLFTWIQRRAKLPRSTGGIRCFSPSQNVGVNTGNHWIVTTSMWLKWILSNTEFCFPTCVRLYH